MKQTQTPKSSDKCICGHLKSEHGWFDRFTGKKHNSCTYTFNKGTDMSRGCDCKHFKLFKQKEGYCENINSVCEELTSARKALSEQKKEFCDEVHILMSECWKEKGLCTLARFHTKFDKRFRK